MTWVWGTCRTGIRRPGRCLMKTVSCSNPLRTSTRSAFTLIELLVVVAIIALMVGMVVGIAGYASRKSANAEALSELESIKNALEEYRLASGGYLIATVTVVNATYTSFTNTLANYGESLDFTDPWGRPYQYLSSVMPGARVALSYRLWSQGASTTTTDDDVDSSSGTY